MGITFNRMDNKFETEGFHVGVLVGDRHGEALKETWEVSLECLYQMKGWNGRAKNRFVQPKYCFGHTGIVTCREMSSENFHDYGCPWWERFDNEGQERKEGVVA